MIFTSNKKLIFTIISSLIGASALAQTSSSYTDDYYGFTYKERSLKSNELTQSLGLKKLMSFRSETSDSIKLIEKSKINQNYKSLLEEVDHFLKSNNHEVSILELAELRISDFHYAPKQVEMEALSLTKSRIKLPFFVDLRFSENSITGNSNLSFVQATYIVNGTMIIDVDLEKNSVLQVSLNSYSVSNIGEKISKALGDFSPLQKYDEEFILSLSSAVLTKHFEENSLQVKVPNQLEVEIY